jgi:hypothetical protein
MTKNYICDKCNNIFDKTSLGSAKLNNGSIEVQCVKCNQLIRIIENAVCDWPFFIKGPFDVGEGCTNDPFYVLPYKTLDGIKYRCVCHEHVDTKHVVPFRYIGPKETLVQIQKEIEKRHPIAFSLFHVYFFFGLLFGPLLILHAFLASVSPVFATTQFTVMVFLFGVAWYIVRKSGLIRISLFLNSKLRKIWLFVFIITLLIESLLHYLLNSWR